ncbi:multiheme c-type cytochrome [Neiella marina]|nr:hypothetical protein [Neiella marina]
MAATLVQAKDRPRSHSNENCVDCHQQENDHWQQSDHYRSMDVATPESVIGDFDNAEFSHFSQQVRFYTRDGNYYAALTEAGETTEYHLQYTFGYRPLQQYLVDTGKGRLQLFPYAWDAHPKEQGGQRWYHNYANEDIKPADRLHWLQPSQNWNGMCADCHSDGLVRGFDHQTDHFNTGWDHINVGCQSCHGEMAQDHAKAEYKEPNSLAASDWHTSKANLQSIDGCYACHALRSPLTDGYDPTKPFLDQFSPSMLQQPLYYADGQIKEEVYVYGSFQQSKMHQLGVTCFNCHDKHTYKIIDRTNGLCHQCHAPSQYETKQHLMHEPGTSGSECVECHMPNTTYMGVDPRRDHSMRVPRPELTVQYGIPNSCNRCHQDESAEWAVEQVANHYPNKRPLTPNEKAYIELQHSLSLPLPMHLAIINDQTLPELKRASALALLPNTTRTLDDATIKPWVESRYPLIRLATAQVGFLLSEADREKSYAALIEDEYKAVRVKAAMQMLHKDISKQPALKKAVDELNTANDVSRWRGEGGLNASLVHLQLGQLQPAIDALTQAIQVDPYFDGSYVNLADLYRNAGNTGLEKNTYINGIKANPTSALLHYSYGLSLIRVQQKQQALRYLQRANELEPDNSQFGYVYYVALDSVGQTQQALSQLKQTLSNYRNSQQLKELGLYLSRKVSDRASYNWFMAQ